MIIDQLAIFPLYGIGYLIMILILTKIIIANKTIWLFMNSTSHIYLNKQYSKNVSCIIAVESANREAGINY